MLEDHVQGGLVGPTFQCMFMDQYERFRNGDRYWFERSTENTPAKLAAINNVDMGTIICSVTGLDRIPPNVFQQVRSLRDMVDCSSKPELDLSAWDESGGSSTGSSSSRKIIVKYLG